MTIRALAWAAALAVAIGGSTPRAARADSAPGGSPLADDRTLVALAVALACADAPESGPAPEAQPPAPADDGPVLELVASVRAKALRFDVVPKTQVIFRGAKRKTVWKTERVNLPLRPEPGVVYRDVAVRLTVTSDIEELASLLREAKRAAAGIVMDPGAPAAGPASPAPAAPAPAAPRAPAPEAPPASAAPAEPRAAAPAR